MTKTIADHRPGVFLRFEADLDLTVEGTHAHVSGDGDRLIVEAADPARLLETLRRTAGPSRSGLARLADGLAARGASVRLQGPHGHVLTAGADADARALRLLTGTRHVVPGSGRGALALVSTIHLGRWRRRAWVAIATAVTMVLGRRGRSD